MTVIDKPPMPGDAGFVSYIPDSAPFSPEQKDWLNGFFAGFLADQATPPALPAAADPAFADPMAGSLADGDDEAPWHDPTIVLPERMDMAKGRPLRRRMMAAMAQQDCGQCGYTCETYANEIVQQAEERLNLCVPGGKETARTLKKLIEEMGGGATDPDEAKARLDAKAAARLDVPATADLGYSREAPVEARFLSSTLLNKGQSEKSTWHIEFDLSGTGLAYTVGDSFGVYPINDRALVDAVIAAIDIGSDTVHLLIADLIGPAATPTIEPVHSESELLELGRVVDRRGRITGQDQRGNAEVINAMVPLANMFGYVNTLRSMSQGRAQYTMHFDHYEQVPQAVADEVRAKMA